jgi:recombination protein RecA
MKKELKELKAHLEKQFGKGAVMLLGDEEPQNVEVIPTNIFSIDRALGVGGAPRGRMIEIYGPEAAGKTTLALYLVASAQEMGLNAAYIDAENSLNLGLAKTLGVNVDELMLSQPDSAEQALDLVESLARSGDIGIIVVDSVAALVPQAEIEGDHGASHMGLQARLMSQACRKLTKVTSTSKTLIVWINQIRMKIGVMYGNPETTTGGHALKFYCSQRIEVRMSTAIKDGEKKIGHQLMVKIMKNKVATPFAKVFVPLIYGHGVDRLGDVFELAVNEKLIQKAGAWYSYKGERLGQGSKNSIAKLSENQEWVDEITEHLSGQPSTKADEEV